MTTPLLPKPLLVLLALLQGLSLYLLHEAIHYDFWPASNPHWLFFLYSIVLILPVSLLLTLEQGLEIKLLKRLAPFTLLCAALGYYTGLQAIPLSHISYEPLLFVFINSMLLACFKALLYLPQYSNYRSLSYPQVFATSWRNFLTLGLALLFTLAVWGVLMMWAALFAVIDIEFFSDLFIKPWFYYPTLNLAFGFGIMIFRDQTRVIDSITSILQAMMKFLLVILALVSLLFLATLPVSGLSPLWKTGFGTSLILVLQALLLFFVNAVYQAEVQQRPYPLWLHRLIYLSLALLPVYSCIALYGLLLRIDQYGWSISRCWGLLVWLTLSLFAFGYLWGIVKKRDYWLEPLSRINLAMGWVLLALMLLVNSPLLDFRKITVQDQLARLADGRTKLSDFDFQYFRYDLAKPGYLALMQLKAEHEKADPALALKIDALYRKSNDAFAHAAFTPKPEQLQAEQQQFLAALQLPHGTELPEGVKTQLFAWLKDNHWQLTRISQYQLQAVDLNQDQQQEYLLLTLHESSVQALLLWQQQGQWYRKGLSSESSLGSKDTEELNLRSIQITPVQPVWPLLQIGKQRFQINETASPEQQPQKTESVHIEHK
jgi:hypothetical protein